MVTWNQSYDFGDLSVYFSRNKELHWMASIFAGIIICTMVYDLTGLISFSYFKEYPKLSNAKRVEWKNRGFSTFHAIIVAIVSLYLLFISDLFQESPDGELIINKTSFLSNTILGISIGYFLSDVTMILWLFPVLGGLEYVLHHGLSLLCLFISLTSGQGQIYILMVLFTESTTPFVNLRWYLDVAGQKSSKLYTYNGVALFLGWLVARILLFIAFFVHMSIHFDEVEKICPMGFYSLLVVPPVFAVMNIVWFWRITKGLVKTLSKTERNRRIQ